MVCNRAGTIYNPIQITILKSDAIRMTIHYILMQYRKYRNLRTISRYRFHILETLQPIIQYGLFIDVYGLGVNLSFNMRCTGSSWQMAKETASRHREKQAAVASTLMTVALVQRTVVDFFPCFQRRHYNQCSQIHGQPFSLKLFKSKPNRYKWKRNTFFIPTTVHK